MKERYWPKTPEQRLGYLIEEAGEVLAAAGKTMRWGWESFNPEIPPGQRETNREWLRRELRDLRLAIDIIELDVGSLSPVPPPTSHEEPAPGNSHTRCANCGHVVPDYEDACSECGWPAPVPPQGAASPSASATGAPTGDAVCLRCGTHLPHPCPGHMNAGDAQVLPGVRIYDVRDCISHTVSAVPAPSSPDDTKGEP